MTIKTHGSTCKVFVFTEYTSFITLQIKYFKRRHDFAIYIPKWFLSWIIFYMKLAPLFLVHLFVITLTYHVSVMVSKCRKQHRWLHHFVSELLCEMQKVQCIKAYINRLVIGGHYFINKSTVLWTRKSASSSNHCRLH